MLDHLSTWYNNAISHQRHNQQSFYLCLAKRSSQTGLIPYSVMGWANMSHVTSRMQARVIMVAEYVHIVVWTKLFKITCSLLGPRAFRRRDGDEVSRVGVPTYSQRSRWVQMSGLHQLEVKRIWNQSCFNWTVFYSIDKRMNQRQFTAEL